MCLQSNFSSDGEENRESRERPRTTTQRVRKPVVTIMSTTTDKHTTLGNWLYYMYMYRT